MRLGELLTIYAALGLACAIAIARRGGPSRGRTALSAVLAVPLWPLWAPVALAVPPRAQGAAAPGAAATSSMAAALDAAVAAVAGTPAEALFTCEAAARIGAEVARAEERLATLSAIACDDAMLETSEATLRALEARAAPARTVASARLRLEGLRRLCVLRAEASAGLEDLAALLSALHAQLLVARFEGAAPGGDVGELLAEVWARLEGMAAMREEVQPRG